MNLSDELFDNVIPESLDMIALKYGVYCKDTMSGACLVHVVKLLSFA